MRLKKITLLLAAVVGVSAFAACGKTNKKTSFSEYWQYSSAAPNAVDETLEYKVEFKKASGLSSLPYTLEYGVGSYVTSLKSEGDKYTYHTQLTMPMTYTLGEAKTDGIVDSVTTEVVFSRTALKPISSKKTVVSHTPATATPSTIEDCYAHYEYTVETTYNADGGASSTVTYTTPEGIEPLSSSFNYTAGEYSYIDNEQLFLALRAIPMGTTSGGLQSYNSFLKKVQTINYTFDEEESAEFSYEFTRGNTQTSKQTVSYRQVSFSLDEKDPGPTQKALIATHSDAMKNTYRNVLLSLETPITYASGSLGTFVYTLTKATTI